MVPSLSHTSISKQLRQQGIPHSMMVHIREGLPTIDIAIERKTGSRSAALQVMASHLSMLTSASRMPQEGFAEPCLA
jgi:hypothetical protein